MFSFACIEQPTRCLISSPIHDNKCIAITTTSTKGNTILITDDQNKWTNWMIYPDPLTDGKYCYITFVKEEDGQHENFYLSSNASGNISIKVLSEKKNDEIITKNPNAKFFIRPASSDHCNKRHIIQSVAHGTVLSFNYGNNNNVRKQVFMAIDADHDPESHSSHSSTWNIDLLSGELCFISSMKYDKRMKCEPFGKLSMTKHWEGWEVWRFIMDPNSSDDDKTGVKTVLISSWTHDNKFLCSNAEGDVYTTENRTSENHGVRWKIEKKSHESRGILITSCLSGYFLQTDGKHLFTSKDLIDQEYGLWCTETACSQTYFISSRNHKKQLSSNKKNNFPFTTSNRKEWEKWKIERRQNSSTYTIYSLVHQQYLGSTSNGHVNVSNEEAGIENLWKIESSPIGGFFLVSIKHKRFLTCSEEGTLSTIKLNDDDNDWKIWNLEPCMPHTIAAKEYRKYITFGISGAISLGLMISMPFAVMGVVGALGFTETGIAAGSIAAGLMSAGSAAHGGGVVAGGVVAMLQSIGVSGLGLSGTSAAVGSGAVIGGVLMKGSHDTVICNEGSDKDCNKNGIPQSYSNGFLSEDSKVQRFIQLAEWRNWK